MENVMIEFKELLNEYRGPNFMKPLYDKLLELDGLRDSIRQEIIKKKLRETSTDRHFKYVEEFLDKAIKYSRLGSKVLKDIGADN